MHNCNFTSNAKCNPTLLSTRPLNSATRSPLVVFFCFSFPGWIQKSTTTCHTRAGDGLVGKASDINARDPGSIPESTFWLNNIPYPTNIVDAQSNGSSQQRECPLNVEVFSHTMWMPTSRGRIFTPISNFNIPNLCYSSHVNRSKSKQC